MLRRDNFARIPTKTYLVILSFFSWVLELRSCEKKAAADFLRVLTVDFVTRSQRRQCWLTNEDLGESSITKTPREPIMRMSHEATFSGRSLVKSQETNPLRQYVKLLASFSKCTVGSDDLPNTEFEAITALMPRCLLSHCLFFAVLAFPTTTEYEADIESTTKLSFQCTTSNTTQHQYQVFSKFSRSCKMPKITRCSRIFNWSRGVLNPFVWCVLWACALLSETRPLTIKPPPWIITSFVCLPQCALFGY